LPTVNKLAENFTPSNVISPVADIMNEPETEEEEPVEDDDDLDFDDTEEFETSEDEEITIDEDLTEDDLNFIEENASEELLAETMPEENPPVVPVYPVEEENMIESVGEFSQGDSVTHPRYGRGIIEKIIKYGNKTLCSISFENVGRRLLDPTISELSKV
jgi:hypothetical protein